LVGRGGVVTPQEKGGEKESGRERERETVATTRTYTCRSCDRGRGKKGQLHKSIVSGLIFEVKNTDRKGEIFRSIEWRERKNRDLVPFRIYFCLGKVDELCLIYIG